MVVLSASTCELWLPLAQLLSHCHLQQASIWTWKQGKRWNTFSIYPKAFVFFQTLPFYQEPWAIYISPLKTSDEDDVWRETHQLPLWSQLETFFQVGMISLLKEFNLNTVSAIIVLLTSKYLHIDTSIAALSEMRWQMYLTMVISSLLNISCSSFKMSEVSWFEPDKFSLFSKHLE